MTGGPVALGPTVCSELVLGLDVSLVDGRETTLPVWGIRPLAF
jgi:hypothetical protein